MQKKPQTEIKTASFSVTAADSGKVYIVNAADLVASLPATELGLEYTFVVQTASTTTGFSLSPVAADNINGGTDNVDLVNTAATDAVGDMVKVIGDGVAGWLTIGQIGTWA